MVIVVVVASACTFVNVNVNDIVIVRCFSVLKAKGLRRLNHFIIDHWSGDGTYDGTNSGLGLALNLSVAWLPVTRFGFRAQ